MGTDENTIAEQGMSAQDIYFIETYLRQKGDFKTILAIDALVIRNDLQPTDKARMLQEIIQGAFNGER